MGDKELVAAAWLHVRGDGFTSSAHRAAALARVKQRWEQMFRGFEPATYLDTLPPMDTVRELHPDLFSRAYLANSPPTRALEEDLVGIMNLDASMSCRGGGGGAEVLAPPAALQQLQQQGQQLQGQQVQNH